MSGFSYLWDVVVSVPANKRWRLPDTFIRGIAKEFQDIINLNSESKKRVIAIKDKYRIDEVKLDARGFRTDLRNVYQSQMVVMEVDGKDYAFILTWDTETNEPFLAHGPVIDDYPYQNYPEDPQTLLR